MRAALCQMRSGGDVEANVTLAERLLNEAAEKGRGHRCPPGVFAYLGSSSRRAAVAEPIPGPVTEGWPDRARPRSMWVLGGG